MPSAFFSLVSPHENFLLNSRYVVVLIKYINLNNAVLG